MLSGAVVRASPTVLGSSLRAHQFWVGYSVVRTGQAVCDNGRVSFEHLLVTADGPITTITLNRPEKRNALSMHVMLELTQALHDVASSDADGVILAANGPVFSAGHNFADMAGATVEETTKLFEVCTEMMDAVQSMPQPVVAKVHALATAAGCQLVATCDLAVAADTAAFAIPGGKGGLFCHTPLVAVARNVGRKRALEMALTCDPIDAATADDWGLFHVPTWVEDPRTPLKMIAAYLRDPTRSPGASLVRATELRETAERAFATRLDPEKRAQLQAMLDVARPHVMMSEGRARWQLTIVGSMRVPVLALGQKLQAAGALDQPNDAFYLTSAELSEAAARPTAATKALVQERKAELAAWEKLTPPPFLGAPPDMASAPPEVQSVFRRFFGFGTPISQDPSVVTGNAASGGVVRGRARVIKRLADADARQPGELLVCAMTAPPWTPLFAIAAGVVTDTGGILSHSAICAREFAIPCVVGTTNGTSVIPDGAMITVDGDTGIVRIEG